MRHVYTLQDETIKALKGREAAIADEMNVSDRYIYAILGGMETDPFAKFVKLYAAAVRAGSPTRHWDERLAAIRERHSRHHEQFDLKAEVKKYAKESTDVSLAMIDNDPHAVLREAREAIEQGKRLEQAALLKIEGFSAKEAVQQFRSKRIAVTNGGAR